MPIELPDTYRQLPVYLLIDTSGSMSSAPIEAVNEGLEAFEQEIRQNEDTRTTARISVITFDSDARQVVALVEAEHFTAPKLEASSGSTALSRGLEELRKAIDREIRPKSDDYPGDFMPMVFLFTDGMPNPKDPWREQLTALMSRRGKRPGVVIAIGAGPEVNPDVLREIAPEAWYLLTDVDRGRLKAMFKFIIDSTIVASQAASQGAGAPSSDTMLAPPPPNLFTTEP